MSRGDCFVISPPRIVRPPLLRLCHLFICSIVIRFCCHLFICSIVIRFCCHLFICSFVIRFRCHLFICSFAHSARSLPLSTMPQLSPPRLPYPENTAPAIARASWFPGRGRR